MEILHLKAADLAGGSSESFRARFEKGLARKLSADWKPMAEAAVVAGVAAFKRADGKGSTTETVTAAVANAMRGFPDKVDQTIVAQTAIFYRGANARFLRDFSNDHAAPPEPVTKDTITTGAGGLLYPAISGGKRFVRKAKVGRGGVDFALRDQQAIQALSDLSINAASRYFPEQLRPKVAEVVSKVVLKDGLSTADAAKQLQAEISGALGAGMEIGDVVAPQFATNPEAYFRILAGQSATLANSVGRILSMDQAGVEKFEIAAVIDRRTSQICRSLNGKVIGIGEAVSTVDRLLEFKGTRQVETLLPFTKGESAPAWASSIGFPPYHHGACRTQVIPVVE